MSRSSQLEREVEASRASLEDTVEALKDKMSVGEMVNEATRYLSDSGGSEIVQNLVRQARANPMPVALIGIGILWLMSGLGSPALSSRRPKGGRPRDYERRYGGIGDDEYRRTFGDPLAGRASEPRLAPPVPAAHKREAFR